MAADPPCPICECTLNTDDSFTRDDGTESTVAIFHCTSCDSWFDGGSYLIIIDTEEITLVQDYDTNELTLTFNFPDGTCETFETGRTIDHYAPGGQSFSHTDALFHFPSPNKEFVWVYDPDAGSDPYYKMRIEYLTEKLGDYTIPHLYVRSTGEGAYEVMNNEAKWMNNTGIFIYWEDVHSLEECAGVRVYYQ